MRKEKVEEWEREGRGGSKEQWAKKRQRAGD